MSNLITWIAGSTPPGMSANAVKRIQYAKSPTDITPITADFSGALSAIDCDTLSETFTPRVSVIRNDGVAADCYALGTPAFSPDATRVTVWLAGGTIGNEYLISTTVMSADGQEIQRSFILPCGLR